MAEMATNSTIYRFLAMKGGEKVAEDKFPRSLSKQLEEIAVGSKRCTLIDRDRSLHPREGWGLELPSELRQSFDFLFGLFLVFH